MAWLAALGGLSALGSIASSVVQARAAGKAAARSRAAGEQAVDELRGGFNQSLADLQGGYDQGAQRLQQAYDLYGAGLQPTRDFYSQQQQAGVSGLQRLQDAILGGPSAGQAMLAQDPGYALRQQQGELSLQRAAAASGTFGSGGNFKNFLRFNQDLASQEYSNALNRIMSLVDIGQQGAQGLTGLAGAQAGILGSQAQLGINRGQALADLRQGQSANIANALTGNASQLAQFDAARANAIAQGIAGVTNSATNVAQMYGFQNFLNNQSTAGLQQPTQPSYMAPSTPGLSAPYIPAWRMG